MGATIGAVAVGGAIGSAARLLIGAAVQQRVGTSFPVGTLLINVTITLEKVRVIVYRPPEAGRG